MLGLLNVSMPATVDLSEVHLLAEHEMPVMMELPGSTQCFELCWSSSAKTLHAAPKFALRCKKNFVRAFFIK